MSSSLELLIAEEEIRQKIAAVARKLDAFYAGEELTIVMVMKGAFCFTADLIREMKTPFTIETIRASSYGNRGSERGELSIDGMEALDLTSKHVLLVDDIYDSGKTLSLIVSKFEEQGPKTLRTLVLLSKKVQKLTTYIPDEILFEIENTFVVGYGLDYKEHYRGLRGIYKMSL